MSLFSEEQKFLYIQECLTFTFHRQSPCQRQGLLWIAYHILPPFARVFYTNNISSVLQADSNYYRSSESETLQKHDTNSCAPSQRPDLDRFVLDRALHCESAYF